MKCPKCGTKMHTNKIINFNNLPWKKYEQCPKCDYKTEAK